MKGLRMKTIRDAVYAGAYLNDASEAAIRRAVAAGSHYFDAGTMRCFGSKAYDGYDLPDGSTVIVMSNKDWRPMFGGQGVCNGRRHFYLCIVTADGDTKSLDYDVSKGTGYWFSKASAVRAAKAMAEGGAK
jgi:hypothetical protein